MNLTSESIQIQGFIRQWADAELRSDLGALDRVLDAEFICVGPAGFVIDKGQYLAPRRSGDLTTRAFTWDDVQIRLFGDTAIAVGMQTQESAHQGRDSSGRFRATQVLVRRDGGWVTVGLHLSPIAPAPAWILGVLQAAPASR
jgi:ketosteroid isomerase-like protein